MTTSNEISIDHDALTALQEATEEMFPEIIETYLDDTSQRLSKLQAAIKGNDIDSAIEHSHSVKGTSSNIGVCKLAALTAEIESLSKNNQVETLAQQAELAIEEFNIVETELRKTVASCKT